MKKITPKKSSLFSILFFLELLSENPEDPTPSRTQPIQTLPKNVNKPTPNLYSGIFIRVAS